jgi:hypothetical protein
MARVWSFLRGAESNSGMASTVSLLAPREACGHEQAPHRRGWVAPDTRARATLFLRAES